LKVYDTEKVINILVLLVIAASCPNC